MKEEDSVPGAHAGARGGDSECVGVLVGRVGHRCSVKGYMGANGGMGGKWEIHRGYVGVQLTGWKTDCSPLPPSQSFPRTPTLQPVLEITL